VEDLKFCWSLHPSWLAHGAVVVWEVENFHLAVHKEGACLAAVLLYRVQILTQTEKLLTHQTQFLNHYFNPFTVHYLRGTMML
jgi:hypothetical protein